MLKGTLADFALPNLLQTLSASPGGGTLHLEAPFLTARLGIAPGRVTQAEVLGLSGASAFDLLAGLRDGQFAFESGVSPPEAATPLPMTRVLARLMEAQTVWQDLKAIPEDWGLELRLGNPASEVELSLAELGIYTEADGRRIVDVLAREPVLEQARTLQTLLQRGLLRVVPAGGTGDIVLLVLPYYGPNRDIAYLDTALYERWAKALGGGFKVKVRSPKGQTASFKAEPRPNIPERIMLHDQALRRLRVGRGTRLTVEPEF